MPTVLDMCVRPPYGSIKNTRIFQRVRNDGQAGAAGCDSPPASALALSMDAFMDEMRASDAIGMVMMRKGGGLVEDCDNGEMEKIAGEYPGILFGMAGIDALGGDQALADIRKYVIEGAGRGIVMEPAHRYTPRSAHYNDERIFPIYELCQREGVPVMLNWGGVQNFKSLSYFAPDRVDDLARTFPGLKLIMHHAGWPYVREACLIAMRNPNVYLSPSPCIRKEFVGSDDYVAAANSGKIREQLLFSSCYPLYSISEAVRASQQRGFTDEALECFLYKNASRLFGIG